MRDLCCATCAVHQRSHLVLDSRKGERAMQTNRRIPMPLNVLLCAALSLCTCVFAVASCPQTAWAADVSTKDEFVAAANDPDDPEINLTTDIDLTDAGVLDVSGKTIDLGGHTISAGNFTLIFEGSDFSITNGSFDAKGGSYALFIGDEGATDNVVISDVTLKGGINVFNATNVVLRNVTAVGTNYYAIWCDENGHVTVEGGTFSSNGNAVLGLTTQESELDIQGGSFTASSDQPLVLVNNDQYGIPTISGGTFSESVNASYLADGYAQLVKSGSGSYEVMASDSALERAGAVVTVDGVTTYYESLDDAQAAGSADAVKKVCAVTFIDGDEVVSTQKVVEGDTVVEPADPAHDGYTFVGWYTDDAEEAYDFNTAVTDDVELTAVYKQIPAKDDGSDDEVDKDAGSVNGIEDPNSDPDTTPEASEPSVLAKTGDAAVPAVALVTIVVAALVAAALSFRRSLR